jgi:hypothetical protein
VSVDRHTSEYARETQRLLRVLHAYQLAYERRGERTLRETIWAWGTDSEEAQELANRTYTDALTRWRYQLRRVNEHNNSRASRPREYAVFMHQWGWLAGHARRAYKLQYLEPDNFE